MLYNVLRPRLYESNTVLDLERDGVSEDSPYEKVEGLVLQHNGGSVILPVDELEKFPLYQGLWISDSYEWIFKRAWCLDFPAPFRGMWFLNDELFYWRDFIVWIYFKNTQIQKKTWTIYMWF